MEQIAQPKIPLATRILNQSENGAFKDITFSEEHVFFGKHLTERIEEAAKLGFKQARLDYPVPKEYRDFLISECFLIEERFGFYVDYLFPDSYSKGRVFIYNYQESHISWDSIIKIENKPDYPFKSEEDRDEAAKKLRSDFLLKYEGVHEKLKQQREESYGQRREALKERPKSFLERIFNS